MIFSVSVTHKLVQTVVREYTVENIKSKKGQPKLTRNYQSIFYFIMSVLPLPHNMLQMPLDFLSGAEEMSNSYADFFSRLLVGYLKYFCLYWREVKNDTCYASIIFLSVHGSSFWYSDFRYLWCPLILFCPLSHFSWFPLMRLLAFRFLLSVTCHRPTHHLCFLVVASQVISPGMVPLYVNGTPLISNTFHFFLFLRLVYWLSSSSSKHTMLTLLDVSSGRISKEPTTSSTFSNIVTIPSSTTTFLRV